MKPRTIEGCYQDIKKNDPDTGITKSAIRRAVTAGEIPSRRVGVKYMVDEDVVIAYFCGCEVSNVK